MDIIINQETGDVITQQDLDSWCNCGNFPHQKCDECQIIFGEQLNKKP